MSNNTELEVTNNSNEWIDWIEDAISRKLIKYYKYEYFYNVEEIGEGGYAKVYRANWKHSHHKCFALKFFKSLNSVTAKEIVHEIKLQREVDFHENIIRFFGITAENDNSKKYLLVMEYADSGTLRDYLKKYFDNLDWNKKLDLARQLARAVLCLHDEGIVHRDLHSKNILVHNDVIKLADFGLSKRIEVSSYVSQSNLCGIYPYIDPKKFDETNSKSYSLNKKSDVYSIGVLLWEISSGQHPFKDILYHSLPVKIQRGLRETPAPNTPEDYKKIYTDCWDIEPDIRPTMNQVVDRLEAINTDNFEIDFQPLEFNSNFIGDSSSISGQFSGEIIQNVSAEQTFGLSSSNTDSNSNTLFENDFNKTVDEVITFIDKGKEVQQILNYLTNHNDNVKEIYDWLSNNQNNSNSNPIFLLGYFNYFGIGTGVDKQRAFELYELAANLGHSAARHSLALMYRDGDCVNKDDDKAFELAKKLAEERYPGGINMLGYCYHYGIGTGIDKERAFELYKKSADLGHSRAKINLVFMHKNGEGVDQSYDGTFKLCKELAEEDNLCGINMLGYCYHYGIGTSINKQEALKLYEKAADLGHSVAQCNLAFMYTNGDGVGKNYDKAFDLFKRSSDREYSHGICMLGYCYNYGIGTSINMQKAFELYTKAANLGISMAQYYLASMYESGKDVDKDKDKAIYWYERSAEQGCEDAIKKLSKIKKKSIISKGVSVLKQITK